MTDKKQIVWVLADHRAGTVNQALGVAEALSWPFEIKKICYTRFSFLPNMLRHGPFLGIDPISKENLKAPWPDVVLSAGRRLAPVAVWIKKKSQKTKIIQFVNPGPSLMNAFDLVVLPQHDRTFFQKDHIISVLATPHRVTKKQLDQAGKKWKDVFSSLPSPRIALIVGGGSKNKTFTSLMASQLGKEINTFAKKKKASLLLTTSPRTGKNQEQALLKEITSPFYAYQWGGAEENPIFGFWALADEFVVTGDSISMCAETCSTGKPVYIYAPKKMTGKKHMRFHQLLYKEKIARPFDVHKISSFKPCSKNKSLNSADLIAQRIKALF